MADDIPPENIPDTDDIGSTSDSLPTTMKALRYSTYGSPLEVLKLESDIPVPIPQPREILVKQFAAALDAVDYKTIQGEYPMSDIGVPFPTIPGNNVSGVIAQMGEGCQREDLKVGDRVIAFSHQSTRGALGEYVCVMEALVAPAPEGLTFAEASTLPLAGSTAWQALKVGRLREGEKLLVLGGTTSTGMTALQIARALGASKIGCTCSAESFDLVRDMGATDVVDYRNEDWRVEFKGAKFDVVIDCVGGVEAYKACSTRSFELMNLERVNTNCIHSFVTLCGDENGAVSGVGKLLGDGVKKASRNISSLLPWGNSAPPSYDYIGTFPSPTTMEVIAALATGGKRANMILNKVQSNPNYKIEEVEGFRPIRIPVEGCYAFDDEEKVKTAFEKLMSGRSKGKQVILLKEETEAIKA